MKRKIINLIRKVTYCNLGRKKCICEDDLPIYRSARKDITYVASSNNIIRFSSDGQIYYFKECRVHSVFIKYVNDVIDDYFENVCAYVKKDAIKRYVKGDLNSKVNFEKLKAINSYVESHYETIKCDYKGWNLGEIGFPSLFEAYSNKEMEVVEFLEKHGSDFVAYIRNEIYAYDLNNYVQIGLLQTYRPSMSIATKKMAALLGLNEMVPDSWYIKLIIDDGISKIGIVTRNCEGICPLDLPQNKKLNLTYNFQKELNQMNFFDAVCFQRDHKEENYFVDVNGDGKVDKVIALDNDSPMTFFPVPKLGFSTSVFCSPVCYGTRTNRPFVDKGFYEIVMTTKVSKVFKIAKNELPFVQRFCLALRFRTLKKILLETEVLNDEDWSAETIEKEISGIYGKTYLKHYIECDENQLIAEIMEVK